MRALEATKMSKQINPWNRPKAQARVIAKRKTTKAIQRNVQAWCEMCREILKPKADDGIQANTGRD
jgi:hypothetical protein